MHAVISSATTKRTERVYNPSLTGGKIRPIMAVKNERSAEREGRGVEEAGKRLMT